MDFIQNIHISSTDDKILFLWNETSDLNASDLNIDKLKEYFGASIRFENIRQIKLASYEDSSFSLFIIKSNESLDIHFYSSLLRVLKPVGRLVVLSQNFEKVVESLKLAGYVNINVKGNDLCAEKPSYEVGSATKLSLVKKSNKTMAVWKLSDDDDFINEDDLLEEKDKNKPNPMDLRVCGTTGKRKACKDCSCGLAEELSNEKKPQPEVAKSSCGSCYLGDAFRCATCPYLGMPAFKPGEKIQLAGGLLKDDL